MTRAEALLWGRGDSRRIAAAEFPAAVLALVVERQGGRFCEACRGQGLSTPPSEPLEVDHLQPLAEGGDNHWTNLGLKCRAHNRQKGSRSTVRPELLRSPSWARGPGGSRSP